MGTSYIGKNIIYNIFNSEICGFMLDDLSCCWDLQNGVYRPTRAVSTNLQNKINGYSGQTAS